MAIYNLRGYFRGENLSGGCTLYCVRIVPRIQNHAPWIDIELAGDSPFVIQYDNSNTPFEPIRKSTATIRVVASEYFMDICGPDAQHTEVVLTNEDTNEVLWRGWLTNNLLNMPQDGCNETFNLEAIDLISSLEYFDYQCINGKKQIVTFQDIIGQLAMNAGPIDNIYVDLSLKNDSGQTIHMDELKISEQNFFSSDTDEPWKMSEVLEELCRYCGYTAIQWEDDLYLYDAQAHTDHVWGSGITDHITGYHYDCYSGNFTTYSTQMLNKFYNLNMTQDDIRGTGADISLQTVYNTVTVKDSFYEIGDFLPDIYDDDKLTNVHGELWECDKWDYIDYTPQVPRYVDGKNKQKKDASSSALTFYQRFLEHENYHPIYRAPVSLAEQPKPDVEWTIRSESFYASVPGAPDPNDRGYHIRFNVLNTTEEDLEVEIEVAISGISETTTETLAPREKREIDAKCRFSWSWGTYDYGQATYTINGYGPYHVSDVAAQGRTHNYVCGSIMDTATMQNGVVGTYNYEVASKLDFDRYIVISQMDEPNMLYNNPRSSALTIAEKNYFFPPVFGLNSGYTHPIIIDENCYIVFDATAIYERYKDLDYINTDWTSDCTGIGGAYNCYYWGLFTGQQEIWTVCPCLVFKLKCGGYWWDGSGWTQTEQPFYVDLHTPTDDDGYTDFSQWWNKDLEVINNLSWEEYTGSDGHKIPLTGVTFDWNQDIEFYICLPAKIQTYTGNKVHDGMNSYCWVRDFSAKLVTKGAENTDLSDIVYENVIDEYSVNELNDITLKFTTYPNEGQHSYSNVGYNGQLLDNVIKVGLDDDANKIEENIVKKYVNQYSTNTVTQNMTLNLKATPVSRIKDTESGLYFHVCGQEIDYATASQRVFMIESKKYNTEL